jgi:hypothetical protein
MRAIVFCFLPLIAGLLPAGCALPGRPVAGLAASDLATAQAIATAGGDGRGAQCWSNLLPAVQAFGAGQQIGAAAALEVYRVAVIQAEGPCAGVVLPILARLEPVLTAGALALAPIAVP